MTLNNFGEEMKRDIDRFLNSWREKHIEHPEHFPLEMGPGDWHEQFIMWLDVEGSK